MKKLLVLAFVAMMAVGVMAQTATYYVGTTDGTDLVVGIDKDIEIPVFFAGGAGVWVADICLPLAAQYAILDTWNIPLCSFNYWPFNGAGEPHGWSTSEFSSYNDDVTNPDPTKRNAAGYHSISFLGFARTVWPDAAWLHYEVPTQILQYNGHTVNDPLLIGTQQCIFQAGVDPIQGPPNSGDTLGGAGYAVVIEAACLFFSPNQPPPR